MKKMTIKLRILLPLIIIACTTTRALPPQPTVAHVDIPKFMGRWYVIASIPTSFESESFNATETYTWNAKDKRVDIDFRFRKGAFDGKEKIIPQKGFIYNEQTHAEWRIQPFWPLRFAYLIVDLASDYADTIIGVPNREHVWIMARTPSVPPARYEKLVAKAQQLGYDTSKLRLTPQTW